MMRIIDNEMLMAQYQEWRKIQNDFNAEYDCGDPAAKSDFESFIENNIEFDNMLELERYYDRYIAE